jgi:hypothetical protein
MVSAALRFLRVVVLRHFDETSVAALRRRFAYDAAARLSLVDQREITNRQRSMPKLGRALRPEKKGTT